MSDAELQDLAKQFARDNWAFSYSRENLEYDLNEFGKAILDSIKNKLLRSFLDQQKYFEQEIKPHTGNEGF